MNCARLSCIRLTLLSILLASTTMASAQEGFRNIEYRIKGGYFAYFGSYVTWPDVAFEATNDAFVIGVLGNYPFEASIQEGDTGQQILVPLIRGDEVHRVLMVNQLKGKRITVHWYNSVKEFRDTYTPCHILFVCRLPHSKALGESARERLKAVVRQTQHEPVLVVAEAESYGDSKLLAQQGAVITYWNDAAHNQVRMVVNRSAEKDRQLAVSARFLSLSMVTPL